MLSAINARVEGSMLGIVLPEETSPNLQDLADGVTAKVTVLVQPGSDQACLVGMNAIPKLGIRLLRSNGTPVWCCSGSSGHRAKDIYCSLSPDLHSSREEGTISGCCYGWWFRGRPGV